MPTVAMDCPHCLCDKMTFDIVGWKSSEQNLPDFERISIAGFCRNCERAAEGVVFYRPYDPDVGREIIRMLSSSSSDITRFSEHIIVSPPRPSPVAPEHVSPEVKRAFLQGEANRQLQNFDAAGAMYRKALDVATKQKLPGNNDMLAKRLEKMRDAGLLTAEISEWANHIRILGNEATHDADEPTKKEIDDLANLTQMTLIYLFEMPERIKLLRANTVGSRP